MGLKKVLSPIGKVFGGLWWLLNGTRRLVLNLLFLLILIGLLWALFSRGGPPLLDKTTLVLDLKGELVEQYSGSPRDQAMAQLEGDSRPQTRLRDVLAVLDGAARDDRITQLVLDLDEFGGATPAALNEVAAALDRFRTSGKPVVAFADGYDQRSYFIAARADEVYLHPAGSVYIEGFGRYRNYYKDALDRVGISANVIRVGTYKNFAEPYFANGPSPATMEADSYLYNELWTRYQQGIEQARKLEAGAITRMIDELPQRLAAVGGDAAKLALQEKLIDGIKTRDQVRTLLEERGAKDDKHLRAVTLSHYQAQYLSRLKTPLPASGAAPVAASGASSGSASAPGRTGIAGVAGSAGSPGAVGVIVAEGEIVDGDASPGRVGGDSTSRLVRMAREDDQIKAVVLRVNSPGGSAFASELIRRELELTREAGKPVIVSMGGVAASGGYWIAMASDEILADPSTITGSIGVIGMLPTGEKLMEKLSVHTGGYTTTWLANSYDPRRPLDPRFAAIVQSSIEHTYREFTGKAAQARKKSPEQIDAVGQGRVWTGAQALERGLVDRMGSLGDAIAAASQRAQLGEQPEVRYVEAPRGKLEQLISSLADAAAPMIGASVREATIRALGGVPQLPAAMREAQTDIAWLAEQAQGPAAGGKALVRPIVHCLCTPR